MYFSQFRIFFRLLVSRAVGRSENPGMPELLCGGIIYYLDEIGLTGVPKAKAPTAPLGTTGLKSTVTGVFGDLVSLKFPKAQTKIKVFLVFLLVAF